MDIGEFLFGGGGGVDYKQMDLWSKEQKKLFELLFGMFQGDYLTQGPQGGPWGASLAALEQWAQNVYGGGGVTPAGTQAGQSLVDLMTMGPQDIDEYFKATVQDPMLEQFGEDILPAISRKFAPSGFYSSQRIQSENQAREDLLTALSRSRTQMGYEARESDLNRILQAAGIGTGYEMGTRGQLFDIMREGQRMKEQNVASMLQSLMLRPYENIATVRQPYGGFLQGILGPALSGVGMGLGYAGGPAMLSYIQKMLGGGGGSGGGYYGLPLGNAPT